MNATRATPRARPHGFLNPVFQLVLGALLVTVSEVLLKRGTDHAPPPEGHHWSGLTALGSPWVWGGIACYILSFVSWLHVLRHLPLIVAFNCMNSVHVLVPLAGMVALGEAIPPARWGGIVLICAGITLLAGTLTRLEEKL